MNDEVSRLRQLRKTALKTRALALRISSDDHAGDLYERAGVLSWRIARIATGKLRSHPYRAYQRDQGVLETALDHCEAYMKVAVADFRGRSEQVFLEQLVSALRHLEDMRALTLSSDMSEALGRAQLSMRMLVDEVRLQIGANTGETVGDRAEHANRRMTASHASGPSYLAL